MVEDCRWNDPNNRPRPTVRISLVAIIRVTRCQRFVAVLVAKRWDNLRRSMPKPIAKASHSYIRRWTPGRKDSVRAVRVDDGRGKLMGPKEVGGIDDFYRLEADDIDDTSTPRWLLRFYSECSTSSRGFGSTISSRPSPDLSPTSR